MGKLGILLLLIAFGSACGTSSTAGTSSNTANANKPPTDIATIINRDNPLGTPESAIAYQFELVKAGDYEKLYDCFDEKGRKRLSPEIVESAKKNAANFTYDDLVGKVDMDNNTNGNFAIIRMKNNATLTVLKEDNGRWLAEQVWFR